MLLNPLNMKQRYSNPARNGGPLFWRIKLKLKIQFFELHTGARPAALDGLAILEINLLQMPPGADRFLLGFG
jgi:hypothetical protein